MGGIHGPTWRRLAEEAMRIGPWRTLQKLYFYDFFKVGTLMGTDQFGNQYFENREYPHPKDRWVECPNPRTFDPSQVPAEWFGWLHHMIDLNPSHPKFSTLNPKYRRQHLPNLTGTKYRYLPHGHLLNKEAKPVYFVKEGEYATVNVAKRPNSN